MSNATTVIELLSQGDDQAAAIGAPDRNDLSYGQLRQLTAELAAAFAGVGIGNGARIAIVLPNGPEMAMAFIALASFATTAPLNPGYREEEFDFYLGDLGATAVLVETGSDSPVRTVAERRGIPVYELQADLAGPAGKFSIVGLDSPAPGETTVTYSKPEDIGLILHTSGTTSRPKMVPLSQANLAASAGNIAATLALQPGDRCLNIMPLFHIHGLIAAVLSSLAAGASVHCSPGFNALKFFAWLDAIKPSWYTAVPTMHQTILARAARNQESVKNAVLRFVRSSSSSLAPQVMAELEETFGAPVIEAYGMTEAAHQMASNQLPPGLRKAGTVGKAAGPEVAIMSENDSEILAAGEIGEIVIRGTNVTAGYLENPTGNATAFEAGWFRTGDQGKFDEDGQLTLTGRLKEIINRGGEKISPREVDEILLDHDAVAQVVTFAMPHDKLGEEVAAAVVLVEGAEATEAEIRKFAAGRLADFKVPRKIVMLEEIPKGATGKLQRIGLAEKLGLA
jgi:acyl-CoA synthetase (AMP-forming)/AMP-acid ligase II